MRKVAVIMGSDSDLPVLGGAFEQLKHNRNFVRFLTAGNVKVACELFLLAISQNIRKAIVKCDTGRLENHFLHPASMLNF